jgi:RNA polymerase sigma factor (sigma-70 family)
MTTALQGNESATCTEHELVAAVRRGDDRAFEALFSRYERRITAYVNGMLGDHARAEDITQDVFISALRRMRETNRPIIFKPWIYEIAKNACIDEFRRARRNQEILCEDGDGSAFHARDVYVHAPPPHAAVESKQRLDDLCGAFGALTERHHRVLVLRELEGLSYAEIGERLGMTRAMVESTLFRARRRLGEEYEELATGRRCARVQSMIESAGSQTLTTLGGRDRRQLTRHLAHCQPCRRRAMVEGVDESLLKPRRRLAGIAALLPLPLIRWRRGGSGNGTIVQSGSHSVALTQSVQGVAQLLDPSGPAVSMVRAAATAAAVALAGAGGGLIVGGASSSRRTDVRTRSAAPAASPASVLSFTKILAPPRPAAGATGAAWFGPLEGVAAPGAAGSSGRPAGGGALVGSEPVGVGVSGGARSTAGEPAAGGTAPASGAGGSLPESGVPSGTPGGASGGSGTRLPTGDGTPGTSAPSETPTVPPPPQSDAPNTGPTPSANPGVQTPAPQVPSPSTVQSAAQNAQPTVNQTVNQVPQSPSSSPPSNVAISPPSGT